jgi:transposase
MGGIDPVRLVFVDECGTHTSMTRRRARARGAVPRNRGPVTTLLAGLSLTGLSPAMTVEGGITAAVFAAHLERVLTPVQLVVVDNVGAHKPERITELRHAAGCERGFLPAYSPDLPPVVEAFSKIETGSRPPVRAPTRRWTPRSPPAGSPTPATSTPNPPETAVSPRCGRAHSPRRRTVRPAAAPPGCDDGPHSPRHPRDRQREQPRLPTPFPAEARTEAQRAVRAPAVLL